MARHKQKSGQAAMEFLMTYGWAILVVLVVIGALAYFGVLNPQSFLPKRCLLGSGLTCADSKLSITSSGPLFEMTMVNSLANPITVTGITLDDAKLQDQVGTCTTTGMTIKLLPGEQSAAPTSSAPAGMNIDLSQGSPCIASTKLAKGMRIKATLSVTYTDEATQYSHTQDGEVILDVE